MRQVEIVLGVLQQGDDYLLQHRIGDQKIGAAGLIGCFGGKVNPGERLTTAVAREIAEETNYISAPDDWKFIGEVRVISDHQLEEVDVHASVFQLFMKSGVDLTINEGELVRLSRKDIAKRFDELTPATRALFQTIIKE